MKQKGKLKKKYEELARILGSRGGLARAGNMSAEKRAASARKAARIRWARKKNGDRLRQQIRQELILPAKRKTMEERLNAYFVLSRDIASLSLEEKTDRCLN